MMVRPLLCTLLLVACGGGGGGVDADSDAPCALDVSLGVGAGTAFAPLSEGDSLELLLGFQGFRMIEIGAALGDDAGDLADVSAFATISSTGVEASQTRRDVAVGTSGDGSRRIEGYLLFFNDAPASQIVGQDADLEIVVRSNGCAGGDRVQIALRDDDDCVDTEILLDAAVPDAGPDAAVCTGAP